MPPDVMEKSEMEVTVEAACDISSEMEMETDAGIPMAGSERELHLQMYKDLLQKESPFFKLLLEERIDADEEDEEERRATAEEIILSMEEDVLQIIVHVSQNDELPPNMTTDLELEVLKTSFQYSFNRLMEITVAHLQRTMKPESAFKILESARAVECTVLEELAFQTIIRNPDQLLQNTDLLFLGCHDISRILSSDELSCKEVFIFQAAYSWALNQAKETPSDSPSLSMKYYFNQVSTYIRYELMSLKELANITLATGDLLPLEETISLFQRALLPDYKSEIPIKYSDKPRSDPSCQRTNEQFVSMTTQTDHEIVEKIDPALKAPPVPDQLKTNPNPRKRLRKSLRSEPPNKTLLLERPRRSLRLERPGKSLLLERPRRSMRLERLASTSSTRSSTTKSPPPPKVKRIPTAEIQESVQSDSEEDLFLTCKKICRKDKVASTYEDAVRRYIFKTENKESVSEVIFSNLTIQSKYSRISFPSCKEMKIDANCTFFSSSNDATFSDFISHFDVMRYLVCNSNSALPMTPENIWALNQDILLKFNGVTFLKVDHWKEGEKEDTLVLNYVPDSKRILSNPTLKPKVLALSNCEFSVKLTKDKRGFKDKTKNVEKLVLYKVWGDFTLQEVTNEFPNLRELCVWKHIPEEFCPGNDFSTPLSVNVSHFAGKRYIRRIALFRTKLTFPLRCTNAAASVTELILDQCYVDVERNANITDVFHQVFPNLEKLVLSNDTERLYKEGYSSPVGTPDLVNSAVKNISSLKEILVRDIRWGENELEDEMLSVFLEKEANLLGKPRSVRLVKTMEGSWTGKSCDDNQQESDPHVCWSYHDEYYWYNLDYFYESVKSFEDYFIAENFPKPILWM